MPRFILPPAHMTKAPAAGTIARDLLLVGSDGTRTHLADLWIESERGVALVFFRHLGCPVAQRRLTQFRDSYPDFLATGFSVAGITPEAPEVIAATRKRRSVSFPILSDRDRSAFQAYGLHEGTLRQVLSREPLGEMIHAVLRGFPPRPSDASQRQLPGLFVIDRDGIVQHGFVGRHASDLPEPAALLREVAGDLGRNA